MTTHSKQREMLNAAKSTRRAPLRTLNKIERILASIVRHGHLEDRSEYMIDDLRMMYNLTHSEAEQLSTMINSKMMED